MRAGGHTEAAVRCHCMVGKLPIHHADHCRSTQVHLRPYSSYLDSRRQRGELWCAHVMFRITVPICTRCAYVSSYRKGSKP
ncbi:hypothetical protein LSCM4_06850 [Leishmania orientalis]|uniref:Uncharacterized protein n=1 Tax=Leishmania orientalis TaxID=2249476 RepID=A0A836KT42_9TRYP|nr:hypothetical protein LSCM4_06850 [Leishmania orientalis]